jgi:hypothetical protein
MQDIITVHLKVCNKFFKYILFSSTYMHVIVSVIQKGNSLFLDTRCHKSKESLGLRLVGSRVFSLAYRFAHCVHSHHVPVCILSVL